ncbi:transforming growth factor beta-1-induced transcript 1 protein isoform X2 [Latimeria chalumnae]|uniref:transforming growth factor beta-1-induced transcript 1 protein isoform X2 n=1 Tax=Latimeria chalumnae TaxID=7897 RepID=UPI00313E8B0D
MDDLDALLADLETTTSLISKHPVLLTDPPGPRNLDPAMLGRQTHSNGISRDALEPRPPPPAYTPQQTVLSAATVGFPGQQPLKSGDKEHLYSTVCKPKSPKVKEQPTFSSSSVLGGGLCELDRLLQELNATQFNITDEIMSQFPNEKGKEVVKTKEPPAAASAKLSAGPTSRGMESMPVSESSMRGEEVTPRAAQDGSAGGRAVPQTPARPSATSATLELDKLMASLSDFKVQSNITVPPFSQTLHTFSPGTGVSHMTSPAAGRPSLVPTELGMLGVPPSLQNGEEKKPTQSPASLSPLTSSCLGADAVDGRGMGSEGRGSAGGPEATGRPQPFLRARETEIKSPVTDGADKQGGCPSAPDESWSDPGSRGSRTPGKVTCTRISVGGLSVQAQEGQVHQQQVPWISVSEQARSNTVFHMCVCARLGYLMS